MANRASLQDPTASPASQVRRSPKSRNSIVGTLNQNLRQPNIRRISKLIEDFDWNEGLFLQDDGSNSAQQVQGNEPNLIDPALFDQDVDFVNFEPYFENNQGRTAQPETPISNFYDNPGVAVPSTPRTMAFLQVDQQANQQVGPPMGNQSGTASLTSVNINGREIWVQSDILNALFSGVGPQTMLTDAKCTSVPKSPGIWMHQSSQFHGQVPQCNPYMGQPHVNPAVLDSSRYNSYFKYPYPTGYHSGSAETHQTQPYYQDAYLQGVPSPGLGPSNRFQHHMHEFIHAELTSPQNFNKKSPSAVARSGSISTLLSRDNTPGREDDDSYTSLKKKSRPGQSHTPLNKQVSVFDRDMDHQYQKPKVAAFNPAVRINKTTKGLTTRTAKINEYDPRMFYTYSDHPLGTSNQPFGTPWSHPNSQYWHRYRDSSLKDGDTGDAIAIYELEDRAMPAEKIMDFILNYPYDRNTLTLRIQVSPGDSGRRYKNAADKCRFAECPNRQGGLKATIRHGWYRVAFDERNDDRYDPFAACCGFAHLYCMERFLDFEYVCRKAHVVVDFRTHLRNEPKGTFAAAFRGKQIYSGELAREFIRAARSKPEGSIRRQRGDNLGVRQMPRFVNYPDPFHQYRTEDTWDATYPFEDTLSYHMMEIMERERPFAQLEQFAKATLGPTKLSVHRGDLGMFAEAHVRTKGKKAMGKPKAKKVTEADISNDNTLFDLEVHRRVQRAEEVLALSKGKPGKTTTERDEHFEDEEPDLAHCGKDPWDVDDEESDFENDGRVPQNGTRRSKRNTGKQPNYRDDFDDRGYGRQPGQRGKGKYSMPNYQQYDRQYLANQQQYEASQQNLDQYQYAQDQQYLQDGYAQYASAENPIHERPSKRKRSSVSHPGYQRAHSYHTDETPQPWEDEYYADHLEDVNHLGLDFNLDPSSPRSPARKRKRFSKGGDSPQSALSSRRLRSAIEDGGLRRLSSIACSSRSNSIMRQRCSRTLSVNKRHASFNEKPVTRQKTFNYDAPPHNVQSRMVKELEIDSHTPLSAKLGESPGRTLRSAVRDGR